MSKKIDRRNSIAITYHKKVKGKWTKNVLTLYPTIFDIELTNENDNGFLRIIKTHIKITGYIDRR